MLTLILVLFCLYPAKKYDWNFLSDLRTTEFMSYVIDEVGEEQPNHIISERRLNCRLTYKPSHLLQDHLIEHAFHTSSNQGATPFWFSIAPFISQSSNWHKSPIGTDSSRLWDKKRRELNTRSTAVLLEIYNYLNNILF